MADNITPRKIDHLSLCGSGDVEFHGKSTLFEEVFLVHEALPELAFDAIDTTAFLLGKRLSAPLIITGMTGGTPRAGEINRSLASVAESLGLGFGVGSQRAMLERPASRSTWQVRDVAPTALILGNIGAVQARQLTDADVLELVESIGAVPIRGRAEMASYRGGGSLSRSFVQGLLCRLLHTAKTATTNSGLAVMPPTASRPR